MTIRLFAALPAPEEIAQGLARRQQGLPRAKWSPAEKLHITLSFYGEMTEATAADLDDRLAAIEQPAFDVGLRGVGAFGEGDEVRSVWAGVATPNPALERLASRCEAAGRHLGLKMEVRTYRPHMTLAYLRRSPPDRVAARPGRRLDPGAQSAAVADLAGRSFRPLFQLERARRLAIRSGAGL